MSNLPENEKDVLNQLFSETEKYPVIGEVEPKLDKEVVPLIEKIEKDISLSKPINDNYGQPLISPPASQNPKITLPVTKATYSLGLTQKITDSVRWLAEWCLRIIKIFGTQAVFREEKQPV